MKRNNVLLDYTNKINEIPEESLEAVLTAFGLDAFYRGMRIGRRNALFFTGFGIATVAVCSCAAWLYHSERCK